MLRPPIWATSYAQEGVYEACERETTGAELGR